MNATLMPDFGRPTISLDFNQFGAGNEGPVDGMTPYVQRLDHVLEVEGVWQWGRWILVGHSFGGMLALAWLLAHGSDADRRPTGLVLISTSAGPLYDRIRLRLGHALRREVRVGLAGLLTVWNRRSVTWIAKALLGGNPADIGRVDFRSLRRRSDLALDLAGWRNTDWRAMRNFRLALRGFDVRERLGEISVPTVVLHGTRDTLLETEEARRLTDGLPSAELRIVNGAGHGLPLTHGEAVVSAVEDLASGARFQGSRIRDRGQWAHRGLFSTGA